MRLKTCLFVCLLSSSSCSPVPVMQDTNKDQISQVERFKMQSHLNTSLFDLNLSVSLCQQAYAKKAFSESGGSYQLWPDNQLDLFNHNNNKAL